MNKNKKIVLQCADCDYKHKKTLKWLENTHLFECYSCQAVLDIDEVIKEIMTSDEPREIFTIYEK